MYLGSRDMVKFGVLVGFAALFLAASIAHGLFWKTNPYWTSSLTKTFLITTIVTLGTTFLSVGPWRGLVLTTMPVRSILDDSLATIAPLWARAKRKDY